MAYMLVQGEDKLCPYVLTGRKKNYGIRSYRGEGIMAYARTWWGGKIVLYRGGHGIRSYRGGGGELESVQARTGGGGVKKVVNVGVRTFWMVPSNKNNVL